MFNLKSIMIIFVALFSFGFPIGLILWWKNKTKVSIKSFLIGLIIFPVFVLILETAVHRIVLDPDSSSYNSIMSSAVIYSLYAAFMAGIFEETGRFVAFKWLLKKENDVAASVGYGIGHGGAEVIILLGATYLSYGLVLAGITLGDSNTTNTLMSIIDGISPGIMGIAAFERISAMILQISLSILVFRAAKRKGDIKLYLIAILLHAMADIPAALYQYGVFSLAEVEIFTFIWAIIVMIFAIVQYKADKLQVSKDPEYTLK